MQITDRAATQYRNGGVLLLIWCCVSIAGFISCGILRKPPPAQPPGALQGMVKEFPDRSRYYLVYSLPGFFPSDLPVLRSATVDRMYVYGEQDMDILMRTTDSIDKTVSKYRELCEKHGWTIERNQSDPDASRQKFTLNLSYKENPVDTIELAAATGRIFAAHRGGSVFVCRIIRPVSGSMTLVIQQIRRVR